MKKIWSIILTVALVVATHATVPVSAAAVTENDITISTNVYDVTCTVETDTKGTMTAMITNSTAANLHGIQSNRTPEDVKDATGNVIGYKYTFNFQMMESDTTGTYTLNIGFKGQKTPKTFPYACLDDKIGFYDTLDTKAAADIKGYFATNPLLVPVELGTYNALADTAAEGEPLDKINAQIVALNLATGVTDADTTTEQKLAKLAPVENLFTTRFAELMKVASIVTATESTWSDVAGKMMGDNTFEKYYYTEATAGTAVIDVDDVYAKFQTEAASMTDYTIAEVKAAFDKATLVYIEEARSVGILKEAFRKFKQNGSITIASADMANIEAVYENADFWNALKNANNTDGNTLVANAVSIASGLISGGGSGGTTGGTTGGVVIDKPTGGGGGGSLGGGASVPTTPVDPEPDTPVIPAGTFSDIASVEWAKESIEALAEMGVLNGKGDGKFVPNDSVTREEFVKIIVSAFELTDDEAACEYNDVAKDGWSYPYIAAANKLGIVKGSGTSFNPKSGISRQDMAVIIHRVFELLDAEISGDSITFDDGAEIADYAKEAVDALTAAGIINGMGNGTFAPAGTVTRAQAAKVVYGLLQLVGGGK